MVWYICHILWYCIVLYGMVLYYIVLILVLWVLYCILLLVLNCYCIGIVFIEVHCNVLYCITYLYSYLFDKSDLYRYGYKEEFNKYFEHIKSLEFTDTPSYGYLKSLFKDLFLQMNYTYDRILFDWEMIAYQRSAANK